MTDNKPFWWVRGTQKVLNVGLGIAGDGLKATRISWKSPTGLFPEAEAQGTPAADNKNQMCHQSCLSQQARPVTERQSAEGLCCDVAQRLDKRRLRWRAPAQSCISPASARTGASPHLPHRMDAAYKRVNGTYGPESEPEPEYGGTGVMLTLTLSHLCLKLLPTVPASSDLAVFDSVKVLEWGWNVPGYSADNGWKCKDASVIWIEHWKQLMLL